MIIEGVVTTVDLSGRLNVAPMGPILEPDWTRLRLRPFRTSTTCRNLKDTGCGVFHVTDDALLIARGALGTLTDPPLVAAERITCPRLVDACRWYEFVVESIDDAAERHEIVVRVVHAGMIRDFLGFHRAKHAVLEAAILATRLHLTGRDEVRRRLAELRPAIDKTAGDAERTAFAEIERFVADWRPAAPGVPFTEVASSGVEPTGVDSTRPRAVVVRTGARLHFGPLASGVAQGRRFGGVGLMVDRPGATVRVEALADLNEPDQLRLAPSLIEPARRLIDRLREGQSPSDLLPAVRIEQIEAIPRHAGLGSGTQTALAIARGLLGLSSESATPPAPAELAGRGLRSGIGLAGFETGGLLIDAGKSGPDRPGTIVARIESPDWPIVLITPRGAEGLSGSRELDAFARLPPMDAALTERLCRIALLDLAPAFQEGDFPAASAALGEFGAVVGRYFAPVQGGVVGHPAMRELYDHLLREGVRGVGQTSWGPTLFVLTADTASAERLIVRLRADSRWNDCDFRIARPLNRGAMTE